MEHLLVKRKLHIVKDAMRFVLILSAASLLFSCGGENSGDYTTGAVRSKSLAPVVKCSDVATIAAGRYHTVGLKEDGTVVGVGYNRQGQLNVSTWKNIKSIAAGANQTIGVKEDGTVVASGNNSDGQLNVSSWTNIKAIAAGVYHTVGLKEDGTVVSAGYGGYGQRNVSSWTNIKAIAADEYHTVGLKEDGTVVSAGYGGYGQRNVSSWTDIKAIAAGMYYTIGLKEDGTVVSAGVINVSTWKNIKAISGSAFHTVGLKEDGTVVASGNNDNGQLNVSSWTNIKAIAAGMYHTVGLKEDGTVVAVGNSDLGQLDTTALFTDIMSICSPSIKTVQDVTSPITRATMTGTLGNNGWYVFDVQMTLTAADNEDGSGVKEIHYSIDGTETVVPGSSATLSIEDDGAHLLTWYGIDNAGNVEKLQEMSINIDKTPPSIPALSAGPSILWPPNHKLIDVLIEGSVSDGGSGIDSTVITVTDEYGVYSNLAVPGFGSAIPLESWRAGTDMDGRVYTITVVTTDQAGNKATGTATVLVPHDMR